MLNRHARRGNYSVLYALLITIIAGMGAMAIDLSYARLAEMETQAVADAASQAALIILKEDGDRDAARLAAEYMVASNQIVGHIGTMDDIEYGFWDDSETPGNQFQVRRVGEPTNAVQVNVSRSGGNAVQLFLATLFGLDEIDIASDSISATRSMEVILAMDITGSWDKDNFRYAREAALTFLDVLHNNYGEHDRVGMTLFIQRYGWKYTPFTYLRDSAADPTLVEDPWGQLEVGNYAGRFHSSWVNNRRKHVACKIYGTRGDGGMPWSQWCTRGRHCYKPGYRDEWSASGNRPGPGCQPAMPHYYSDEGGTDHTTGMTMAQIMFQDQYVRDYDGGGGASVVVDDPLAYRALVVLTDGRPSSYGRTWRTQDRNGSPYETKPASDMVRDHELYLYSGSRSVNAIKRDTRSLAQDMWTNDQTNIWFVSFVANESFFADSSKGDGYFTVTRNSSDIVPIFEEIARSLPLAIVN